MAKILKECNIKGEKESQLFQRKNMHLEKEKGQEEQKVSELESDRKLR